MYIAFPPAVSISLTVSEPAWSFISSTAIFAPNSARRRHVPLPIPDAPPDIIATFPSRERSLSADSEIPGISPP